MKSGPNPEPPAANPNYTRVRKQHGRSWVFAIACLGACTAGSGSDSDATFTTADPAPTTIDPSVPDDDDDDASSSTGEPDDDDGVDPQSGSGSTSTGSETEATPAEFDPGFVEAQIQRGLDEGAPAIAVAVVLDGELVYAEARGQGSATGETVDADTLFNMASVSKSTTAMALVAQAEAGLADLGDPVTAHVPYFSVAPPHNASSVTLHQVLTHTAGLGDWETEPFVQAATLSESFSANPNQPLWADAGAVFNYSNRSYELAGLIVSEIEGVSFADAVAARVLDPLGMQTATMDATLAEGRNHADGLSDGTWVGPADYQGERYQPPAGLWASARDLGAYAQGLLAAPGVLASPEPTHEYFSTYGYGLGVDDELTPTLVSHGGSTGGYLSDLQLVPTRGFGVVVVTNTDAWAPYVISDAIVEEYVGEFDYQPSDRPSVNAAQIPGFYDDPHQLGELEIRRTPRDTLEIVFHDLGQTVALEEFTYAGVWYFVDPTSGYEVDVAFWPDASGAPTHFVSRRGVAARR